MGIKLKMIYVKENRERPMNGDGPGRYFSFSFKVLHWHIPFDREEESLKCIQIRGIWYLTIKTQFTLELSLVSDADQNFLVNGQ